MQNLQGFVNMATVLKRAMQKERTDGWEDLLICPMRSSGQTLQARVGGYSPELISLPPVGDASVGEQLWHWTWAVGTERPRPWRLWVPPLMPNTLSQVMLKDGLQAQTSKMNSNICWFSKCPVLLSESLGRVSSPSVC